MKNETNLWLPKHLLKKQGEMKLEKENESTLSSVPVGSLDSSSVPVSSLDLSSVLVSQDLSSLNQASSRVYDNNESSSGVQGDQDLSHIEDTKEKEPTSVVESNNQAEIEKSHMQGSQVTSSPPVQDEVESVDIAEECEKDENGNKVGKVQERPEPKGEVTTPHYSDISDVDEGENHLNLQLELTQNFDDPETKDDMKDDTNAGMSEMKDDTNVVDMFEWKGDTNIGISQMKDDTNIVCMFEWKDANVGMSEMKDDTNVELPNIESEMKNDANVQSKVETVKMKDDTNVQSPNEDCETKDHANVSGAKDVSHAEKNLQSSEASCSKEKDEMLSLCDEIIQHGCVFRKREKYGNVEERHMMSSRKKAKRDSDLNERVNEYKKLNRNIKSLAELVSKCKTVKDEVKLSLLKCGVPFEILNKDEEEDMNEDEDVGKKSVGEES